MTCSIIIDSGIFIILISLFLQFHYDSFDGVDLPICELKFLLLGTLYECLNTYGSTTMLSLVYYFLNFNCHFYLEICV